MLEHHANRSLAHPLREPALPCHRPILSSNGASDKPGAVQVELVGIGHLEREGALSVGRAIRGVDPFIMEAILAKFEALLPAAKRG
jgi:hypothetical protein